MNSLNKLYEAMILSWGGLIKDDSRIVFSIDGQEYPIKIDNMPMYLPLSEVLDANCIDKVFFHPACENITSKETEVFKIIRKMTVMRLLDLFRQMPVVLFAVSTGKPKSTWNQRTLDMLEPLKGVKQTVRAEVMKLFARMHVEVDENGLDNRFIHFKITKGGGGVSKVSGERVYYKTKPSFPFYTEIVRRLARSEGQSDNQTVELNNHSVSRAALKIAAHLFQIIVPAVNSPDDYEFESTTPVASRLISYLRAYSEIADDMNKIQNTFRSEYDKASLYPIDLAWTESLEELPEIYRQVPVMDYNSHNSQEETTGGLANRTDFGSFLNVSTNNNQQQNQQHNNSQTMQQPANIVGDFDVTPPPMNPGDKWLKSEIDYNNNCVNHHAVNTMNNNPVLYICSKKGNIMGRQETPLMNMMSGMNNNMMNNMMGGAQQLNNGMVLLPNGQVINPMMMGGAQPSMPSGVNNVYNDYNNGGGFNDGQAFG